MSWSVVQTLLGRRWNYVADGCTFKLLLCDNLWPLKKAVALGTAEREYLGFCKRPPRLTSYQKIEFNNILKEVFFKKIPSLLSGTY